MEKRERKLLSISDAIVISVSLIGFTGAFVEAVSACPMPDTLYGKPMTLTLHPRQWPVGIGWSNLQGQMIGEGNLIDEKRPGPPQLFQARAIFSDIGSTGWSDEFDQGRLNKRVCVRMKIAADVGPARIMKFDSIPTNTWKLAKDYD